MPYKRVDVLVRAVAILHEKHPTVRLLVIGQGPERQRLERLAKELGVADRVDFRGFVDRHVDVLSIVAGATAYLSGE